MIQPTQIGQSTDELATFLDSMFDLGNDPTVPGPTPMSTSLHDHMHDMQQNPNPFRDNACFHVLEAEMMDTKPNEMVSRRASIGEIGQSPMVMHNTVHTMHSEPIPPISPQLSPLVMQHSSGTSSPALLVGTPPSAVSPVGHSYDARTMGNPFMVSSMSSQIQRSSSANSQQLSRSSTPDVIGLPLVQPILTTTSSQPSAGTGLTVVSPAVSSHLESAFSHQSSCGYPNNYTPPVTPPLTPPSLDGANTNPVFHNQIQQQLHAKLQEAQQQLQEAEQQLMQFQHKQHTQQMHHGQVMQHVSSPSIHNVSPCPSPPLPQHHSPQSLQQQHMLQHSQQQQQAHQHQHMVQQAEHAQHQQHNLVQQVQQHQQQFAQHLQQQQRMQQISSQLHQGTVTTAGLPDHQYKFLQHQSHASPPQPPPLQILHVPRSSTPPFSNISSPLASQHSYPLSSSPQLHHTPLNSPQASLQHPIGLSQASPPTTQYTYIQQSANSNGLLHAKPSPTGSSPGVTSGVTGVTGVTDSSPNHTGLPNGIVHLRPISPILAPVAVRPDQMIHIPTSSGGSGTTTDCGGSMAMDTDYTKDSSSKPKPEWDILRAVESMRMELAAFDLQYNTLKHHCDQMEGQDVVAHAPQQNSHELKQSLAWMQQRNGMLRAQMQTLEQSVNSSLFAHDS